MSFKETLKPTPIKVLSSVLISLIIIVGVVWMLDCPENNNVLICPNPEVRHEPVWKCTFFCATQAENYVLYVMELGIPFLIIFMMVYSIISLTLQKKQV